SDPDPTQGEVVLPPEPNPVDPTNPLDEEVTSPDQTVPATETPGDPNHNEEAPPAEAPAPTEDAPVGPISEPDGDITVTTDSEDLASIGLLPLFLLAFALRKRGQSKVA
ncbi:hypothetical protein B7Z17_02340, partial [Candidatus Saccharibacteria bacterium 32-49-10]